MMLLLAICCFQAEIPPLIDFKQLVVAGPSVVAVIATVVLFLNHLKSEREARTLALKAESEARVAAQQSYEKHVELLTNQFGQNMKLIVDIHQQSTTLITQKLDRISDQLSEKK